MSKTRSRKVKEDPDAPIKAARAPALCKVFYIPKDILASDVKELKLERFFHPGKGKSTLFLTNEYEKRIVELLEYSEPRRSWLINEDVCSNGKLYMATPIDVTFFALHYLRKYCRDKALALDSIRDDKDESVGRLLTTYVQPTLLQCISDVKAAGGELFYKYNAEKAVAWLALKVRRVANALRSNEIYCGISAMSENYAKSELVENTTQDDDYLRVACDFVGTYISMELHEELKHYLSIATNEPPSKKETNEETTKRKSLHTHDGRENKKIKLENDSLSSIHNDSPNKSEVIAKLAPLKERTLSTKEKVLAKSAKGTKSIASFFKR